MLILRVAVDFSGALFPVMFTFYARKMMLSSLPKLCSASNAVTCLCDIQYPAY